MLADAVSIAVASARDRSKKMSTSGTRVDDAEDEKAIEKDERDGVESVGLTFGGTIYYKGLIKRRKEKDWD